MMNNNNNKPLKLMCILAHPDDESLGTGGILARYAAEGVHTSVITATRGQRGWQGDEDYYPGPAALGQTREAELRAAADVLGVQELILLDYMDGDLDQVEWQTAVAQIAHHIRRIQPQVVVTFDPYGAYGHPDHIALARWRAQPSSPLVPQTAHTPRIKSASCTTWLIRPTLPASMKACLVNW